MKSKTILTMMAVAAVLMVAATFAIQDEASADDDKHFTVDDIRFEITGADTVSVAPLESGKYSSQLLEIPASVTNAGKTYKVTGIADAAFKGTGMLNAVTFPNTLETIGANAFDTSNIYQEVVLPASVKNIGESAFNKATITGLDISKTSIAEIPANAFNSCTMMKTVKLNSGLTAIGDAAFQGCTKITSVNLDATSVKTIGSRAFQNIGTGGELNISIPASVTSIADDSFASAKVNNYTVASGNTAYKSDSGCILNKEGTLLLNYPLNNPQTSFTIPSSVTTLADNAFYNGYKLVTLTIDNSVVLGEYSLTMCSNLAHLIITQKAALPDGNKGIIQTYFTKNDGSWEISNINPQHLVIDSSNAVDLTGVKASKSKFTEAKYIDFTSQTKNTVGGNFTKNGAAVSAAERAGERFTCSATDGVSDNFEYDNTRIMTVVCNPKEGGTVEFTEKVERGATATFTAKDASGFKFAYWNDDKSQTSSTYSVKVSSDLTVTANFEMTENCYITVPNGVDFELTRAPNSNPENAKPSSYNYYMFTGVEPLRTEKTSSGTTYVYILPNSWYGAIVTGDGCVTYKDLFEKKSNTEIRKTVTTEQLHPEGKDSLYVDRTVKRTEGDNTSGILVSGTLSNNVYIGVGQQTPMMVYRQWQAVADTMSNRFLEPEIVYKITDLSGKAVSDVISIENGGEGETTWKINGLKEGTVVVTVWMKAMTLHVKEDKFYGATWPELTQVFVVTVGKEPTFDTGMTMFDPGIGKEGRDRPIDCDMDCFYYDHNDSGYNFTFTPASGTTVTVYNPVLGKNGITGFNQGTATKSGDSWTVKLTEGRNIVKMDNNGQTRYQVLLSLPVIVQINGVDSADAVLKPGEQNVVVFKSPYGDYGGILNNKGKLAGLYNSGATIWYDDEAGERVATAKQPQYGHYFFLTASEYQTLTFTVPADWDLTKKYTIHPNGVVLTGFDGTAGDHRTWFMLGSTNLDAKRIGFLPTISARVAGSVAECEVSNDGGQTWSEYNSFQKGLDAAKDGAIIKVNSNPKGTTVDKAVEIRMNGNVFLTDGSPLTINADVKILGIKPEPLTVFFGSDGHATFDATFEVRAAFAKPAEWVEAGPFITGLPADWVAVSSAGYTAYAIDYNNVGLMKTVDAPFGTFTNGGFQFYKTMEEAVAHLADTDTVYVLSYQPQYSGGKAAVEHTGTVKLSQNLSLKTVVRVTDGNFSTYYVDGKYMDDNGKILELPAVANMQAVLNGSIAVDGGYTLTIHDVIATAEITLGGGMGTSADVAKVKIMGQVPMYRLSIGFEKISDWSIPVETSAGKVYKLKDGCDYEFITSEKVSLNDRVGVRAAGFKANIQPGGLSAKLEASSEMMAYVKTGAESYTGYSSLEDAIKSAGSGGTVYILYYTTQVPGAADVTSYVIDSDMIWEAGYKLDTIHQMVDKDGKSSTFAVDDKAATLIMGQGRTMLIGVDADFTRVYVEGDIMLTGEAVIDFGEAPVSSVGALGESHGITTIDVTEHVPGLIVKNLGGTNVNIEMPGDSGKERYYTYMIGNDLYFGTYVLDFHLTASGQVTFIGPDGMELTLSSGDQTLTGTIDGGIYTFSGLKYNLYSLDAEIDKSRYHDNVYVVVVDDAKHSATVPAGTTGLTVSGDKEALASGPVSQNLYYDADGKVSLTLPNGTTASLAFPMHTFTQVEHDKKVYDHCDCGYEVYLHDVPHSSGGSSLKNVAISAGIAVLVCAVAFVALMWMRGRQAS